MADDKQKNQGFGSNLSPNVRRGLWWLLGILVLFIITALLANVTANDTLREDMAEDVSGDVADIGDEVFDALEVVEESAQAAVSDLAAADALDDETFRSAIVEATSEDAAQVIEQVGLYQADGSAAALTVDDPAALDEASVEAIAEDALPFDAEAAADSEGAFWDVREDGVRYVAPVETNGETAYLWVDLSTDTLNALLQDGAEAEALFAETELGYVLLIAPDNTVITQFNQSAQSEQVGTLLNRLNDETYDEDGEYYEIADDPLINETSFVALLTSDSTDWRVVGGIPVTQVPTQTLMESTLNLFEVSEVGDTVSRVVERVVAFLNEDVGWLFRGLRWPIEQVITAFEDILISVPWIIVIAATGGVALLSGGRGVAIASVLGMFAIGMLGLWELTMTTLAMLLTSMAFCVLVGIPVGILAARNDRVNEIVRSVLDAMQTIHPFVYLVPIVVLFGIGKVPGTIATIIFALPPMVRLTNLGIRQVPEDVVEASKAFGSSDWQLLRDVQIPLALPSIMAGVNQTLMLSLSMVVIVALIAGGGLGQEIYRAIGRADTGRAVVAGVAVLLLAVVVDRISQGKSNPRADE